MNEDHMTMRAPDATSDARPVLILKPRLDVTFKEGPAPVWRAPIPPIREHWRKFLIQLEGEHKRRGDNVMVVERPLWQFTSEFINDMVSAWFEDDEVTVYIPHKRFGDYELRNVRPLFYMQTVFPQFFSIDPQGWGPSMSTYPIEPGAGLLCSDQFDRLRERAMRNESKFEQPQNMNPILEGPYVTFLCQIPHDETIRFHSDVSVEEALFATIEWARHMEKAVLVKGHPVNPGSMEKLKRITSMHTNAFWYDLISVHGAMRKAEAVFCVNSGAGAEALLHNKPVYIFGRAEYDTVVNRVKAPTSNAIAEAWLNQKHDLVAYCQWFDAYMSLLYDSTDATTFAKVPR